MDPIGSQRSGDANSSGQATVFLVAIFGVALLVVLAVALVARRAIDRSVANNAADAVALADAIGFADPARIAEANGAETFSLEREGTRHTAVVRRGGLGAAATAERIEDPLVAAPALVAVLARVEQLAAVAVEYTVVAPDPYAVDADAATPSLTADVAAATSPDVLRLAERVGLCRPDPAAFPDRFRLC